MAVNAVERRPRFDEIVAGDDDAVFCDDPPLFDVSSYVETGYLIEKRSCGNWEMCSQRVFP